jgi:Undecaprenyl-phosphate galactose phosphotransferase WbaP
MSSTSDTFETSVTDPDIGFAPGSELGSDPDDTPVGRSGDGAVDLDASVALKRPPTEAPSTPVQRQATVQQVADAAASKSATLLSLLAADTAGLVVLLAVAWAAVFQVLPQAAAALEPALLLATPVLLLTFALAGFYRPTFTHPAHEMRQMALVTGIMSGTAALTVYLTAGSLVGALLVGVAGLGAAVLVPACRVCARVLFSRWSWWGLPTVVVHAGGGDPDILDTMNKWPEIGLRPVAVLDESGGADKAGTVAEGPDWAPYLADRFDLSYAVISMPSVSHERRAKRLMQYSKFFDHVFVTGDAAGAPALWTAGRSGEGLHGYGVCNAASAPVVKMVKKGIDFVGAVVALLLTSPIFAAISLMIRNGSSGPIFFRQERMGADGEIFKVFKFRSMYQDADERLDEVLANDPERREEYDTYHKLSDDPRVTPTGKFLRRTSLDELPQLLNVLLGDMSLVGPRAYMPSELPKMKGMESVILSTPPGVTGLWQVSGRNNLTFTERVDLDVHYIQNWSLALDLYLLVRTIPTVLAGEGAS